MNARYCIALTLVLSLTPPRLAFSQWVKVIDSASVVSFASNGTRLFAGADDDFIAPAGFKVFLSTDYGSSWIRTGNLIGGTCVKALAAGESNIVAGTQGGYYGQGVYLSTDAGFTWAPSGGGPVAPLSFAFKSPLLFAGSIDGVYASTDDGASWTLTDSNMIYVQALSVKGEDLFAGGSGVYRSSDDGATWTPAGSGLPNTPVSSLVVNGTNIFAGTGRGVFCSTDDGGSWTAVNNGLTDSSVFALAVTEGNLFAGTFGPGSIFLSTNNGMSWASVRDGLPATTMQALIVSGDFLFAGTRSGVWRRPMSELMSTGNARPTLPGEFALGQNYPNPFNPTTDVRFGIGEGVFVSLKVYDLLGREVETLVSEIKQPGTYSVRWNADRQASGVYFYTLRAGEFVQTKKLMLVR